MPRKTLAKFIYDKLIETGWLGITFDEGKQEVKCPKGEILTLAKGEYSLRFFGILLKQKSIHLEKNTVKLSFQKTLISGDCSILDLGVEALLCLRSEYSKT